MAKTIINDKKLYEKRNHDDIFVRDVIGGLLMVLNNRLVYDQIWDDSSAGYEQITIPFYYDIGNVTSERFLQDNYLTFGNQCGFKQINGNFDMLPRGVVSLESLQIEADSITNRMVLGKYQKEDPTDGKIKTYVAFLYAIPLSISVTCEIRSNSFTEMLKINEACNQFFYKNKTYYINHKGMKLGCRVGFPDTFLGEKNTGFTMGGSDSADKINLKQSFELKIECYQPVFDKSTERLESNRIKAFVGSIDTFPSKRAIAEKTGEMTIRTEVKNPNDFVSAPYFYDTTLKVPSKEYSYYLENGTLPEMNNTGLNDGEKIESSSVEQLYQGLTNQGTNYISKNRRQSSDSRNLIYIIDDYKDWTMFPSGATLKLRWQYRKHNADINYVVIKFKENADGYKDEPFLEGNIDKSTLAVIRNELEYDWEIPSDFTGFKGTDIIYFNDDKVSVYKEPVIKVIPDPKTMKITEKSFFCLDPGYFSCPLNQDLWDKKEKNEHNGFSYFTHITAELDYSKGKGVYGQFNLVFPIKDNKIETLPDNPNMINFNRVMDTSINIKYIDTIPYRVGSIIVQDGANENIYAEIPNITIV